MKIREVRAHTVVSAGDGGGADYHDQSRGHWIDDHVATPMAKYPQYRASRQTFGLNALGTLVVEVEAADGTVGFGVTTAGEPGAYVVEQHLARFVEGSPVTDIERIWDQMFLSTLYYGRKGLVMHAISAVDLALYDLLAKLRGVPVHQLLGGPARDELECYATTARPDIAQQLGFVGAKMPLQHGPAEGAEGLRANVERLRRERAAVGPDFFLAFDCWMSLDVEYATRLAHLGAEHGLRWLEEPLIPDDYWGHEQLRERMPAAVLMTTGEHEYNRYGFRMLLEKGKPDIIQPDVNWCGGITELLRISALAEAHGAKLVPHGSSVYSYHFVITRQHSPFTEFLMMHPRASEVIPMFHPLLLDEPVPENGRIRLPDTPGFGVRLNPEVQLHRPYSR